MKFTLCQLPLDYKLSQVVRCCFTSNRRWPGKIFLLFAGS